jgi:hypothetical protein
LTCFYGAPNHKIRNKKGKIEMDSSLAKEVKTTTNFFSEMRQIRQSRLRPEEESAALSMVSTIGLTIALTSLAIFDMVTQSKTKS